MTPRDPRRTWLVVLLIVGGVGFLVVVALLVTVGPYLVKLLTGVTL